MAWRRGRAYSQDIRDRVLDTDASVPASWVAEQFHVSVSYVIKVRARLRRTSERSARPQCGHTPRRLAEHEAALREKVAAEPDATLAELRIRLGEKHQVTPSVSCVWNTLARMGLTLKKSRSGPPSRAVPT